jgi:hypothetical protein
MMVAAAGFSSGWLVLVRLVSGSKTMVSSTGHQDAFPVAEQ